MPGPGRWTPIRARLDQLGPEPVPFLDVTGPGGRIRLYHVARGRHSVTCQRIEMRLRPLPGVTDQPERLRTRLEHWSQRIAPHVEPLHVVEFEPRECRALVRSQTPRRRRDGSVIYHELWWHATDQALESTWHRWQAPAASRRFALPIRLPWPALVRLIRDTLDPATWQGGAVRREPF